MKIPITLALSITGSAFAVWFFMTDTFMSAKAGEAAIQRLEQTIDRVDLENRLNYITLRLSYLQTRLHEMKQLKIDDPIGIELMVQEQITLRNNQKAINEKLLKE